jgi:hypothetical protein
MTLVENGLTIPKAKIEPIKRLICKPRVQSLGKSAAKSQSSHEITGKTQGLKKLVQK